MAGRRIKTKNYTQQEKELFLRIVESKKDTVESKFTNASMIKRKREAWETIAKEFNACAEEPRDVRQLKNLYENCKRKARKDVAEENRAQYEQAVIMEINVEEEDAQAAIHLAKEEAKLQKIEILKTGGGGCVPEISNTSQQILSILGGNIKPNPNMYDSAADYYNDMEPILETKVISANPSPTSMPISPEPTPLTVPNPKPLFRARQNKIKNDKNISSEALKKKYFMQKLRNAQYEAMSQKSLYKLQRQSLMWDLKIKKKKYALLLKNEN